jgi:phosphohistidine phosphatase
VSQLWVLRHAKASAHSLSGSDHDRPLSRRGRRQMAHVAGRVVGDAVADGALLPHLVLSSSATRALDTARLVMPACPGAELEVESALYDADPDDIVDRLRGLEDDIGSVMVVGHNPTLEDLVLILLQPADRLEIEDRPFPTAALAVLVFGEGSWSNLEPGRGQLVGRYVPER